MRIGLFAIAGVLASSCALVQPADAALIRGTGHKAQTSATVRITTNTKGQRTILLTVDPDVATAFQLDVVYSDQLVIPAGFDGINPSLTDEAVEFIPPFGGAGIGGGALIVPTITGIKGSGGVVSNVHGQFVPTALNPTPFANRADGGNDLFTLAFIDLAPEQDKVFTVLGVDSKGIDPTFAKFIADNFIDVLIDDPNDPLNGQVVRIAGDEIGSTTIIVPGVGPGVVPLPPAIWAGLAGAGLAFVSRRIRR